MMTTQTLLNEYPATIGDTVFATQEDLFAFPVSFAQQRLWFLDQLDPGSPLYNISAAVRIAGPLNVQALYDSLKEIVRRHESLRTTFTSMDEQPVQVVNLAMVMPLPIADLRELASEEREAEVHRLAAEEARRPFELSEAPLFRVKLLRTDEEDYMLLLTMHHIISDGWSMGVLLKELSILYPAYLAGKTVTLPELSIQYADYSVWQREQVDSNSIKDCRAYWKKQLGGELPVLELPIHHARPIAQNYSGATQELKLSREMLRELDTLSKSEGATLFMTLMSAFNVLLYRYSGQKDVLVGTPIANRKRGETEGLIGCFVNTLVMRTDLSGNPTFRELLARVRETALEAHAHQDLPYEMLVEELHPDRNLSYNPLFQVMFVLNNAPMPALQVGDLLLQPVRIDNGTAKFDLDSQPGGNTQGTERVARIQHGSVRSRNHPAHAWPPANITGRYHSSAGWAYRNLAHTYRSRRAPTAGGVEQHACGLSRQR